MKKYLTWLVLSGYILLSTVMYPHLWGQLWHDESRQNAVYGEVVAASWGMEQLYQNVLSGKNPFTYRLGQLYPFGNSLLSTDSGNGFFFLFLRPWLSIHQALSLIVILSIVAACLGMYLLLSQLGVARGLAFILGAAFGFTTLLQPRMGHLTYMSIYVFPWFFYAVLRSRPILAALFFVLALYHNLYYFVILGLMSGWMLLYQIREQKRQLVTTIWQARKQVMIFSLASVILLSPWLAMLREVARFEGLPHTEGWGGAIEFSADLFGIWIPSTYSRYLWVVTDIIGRKFPFAWGIFEEHIYPGMIALVGILLIGLSWKKLRRSEHRELKPWLLGGVMFWILTLGPFLHVLGKWRISLEGIPFVVPLPFAFLHYVPLMDNIRSPGRLAIGLVFFAYVVIGLWLTNRAWIQKRWRYYALLGILTVIFVVDHPFIYAPAKAHFLPISIYETIRNDPEFFSVYEMPSAVRDGFKYFGNLESLDFISGQLIHGKPMLAGYFGRVQDFKREYFANNPFFGYMGRLMDKGVEHNGAIDRTQLPAWQTLDVAESQKAIELVNLKYVVVQDDAFFSASASAALRQLDFRVTKTENNFSLWQRTLEQRAITEVRVGQPGDDLSLGVGWRGRDQGFRWGAKTTSILLKVAQAGQYDLVVEGASYYKNQTAKIYINHQYVGKMQFDPTVKERKLALPQPLQSGLMTIHLIFPKAYQPFKVEPGNTDTSWLAVKVVQVALRPKL